MIHDHMKYMLRSTESTMKNRCDHYPWMITTFVIELDQHDLLPVAGDTCGSINTLFSEVEEAYYFCRNVIQGSLDSRTEAIVKISFQ